MFLATLVAWDLLLSGTSCKYIEKHSENLGFGVRRALVLGFNSGSVTNKPYNPEQLYELSFI